jgi:hypothetical protein
MQNELLADCLQIIISEAMLNSSSEKETTLLPTIGCVR